MDFARTRISGKKGIQNDAKSFKGLYFLDGKMLSDFKEEHKFHFLLFETYPSN